MTNHRKAGHAGVLCFSWIALALLLILAYPGVSKAAPAQDVAGQDCAKIKQDIEALQALMAQISAEMQRLRELLDQENKNIAQTQADVRTATEHANAGLTNETLRGQLLDTLARMMSRRNRLEQELEDDASFTQAIEDEIADLLKKLANCSPPSATEPPKQETPKQPPAQPTNPPPQKNKSVSYSGFTPVFDFRGFGGATFINGNTPATAGFDGAALFPLGNRVLVGPTAGFQWVDSSIVQTIGGGPPPSTFIHTSVGFKNGNFGGRIAFPLGGWQLGIHGGATVAGSTITQNEGFCGPTGCTTSSTTTTHDTVVGPFVGGYISHSIFSHVGVFVGYDYHLLKDTKSSVSVFDLHYSDVVAGLVLSFGRHKVK